jgi:transposase
MPANKNTSVCVATRPRPLIQIDANHTGQKPTGPLNRAARTSYVRLRRRTRRGNALVLLAEIGDISRFGSARKLASWAGLTPTVRGSDRTVHHGHISKQGPTWARWVLCEAAQTARRHPDFAPAYEALARRRGKKIATTAVARKLITRAYHLLTDASTAGEPR